MALFEATVAISSTAEAVFEFLACPANVLLISPPEAEMSIVEAPERFEMGSRFEFRVGGFGPIQQILHEITDFSPPGGFTETLVKGPLQRWVHEHKVEPDGDGVIVTDRIEFDPPGGMIGFLVTEEKILDSLKFGFDHRHCELKKILEQAG